MLPGQQRPCTASNASIRRKSRHSSALPPKSESGLLPIVRLQACQSALGSLISKIDNSRCRTTSLSRPKTSYPFNRPGQQSAKTRYPHYLQPSQTTEWLSNKRVTHDEILVPRIIDISAIHSLEDTKLYSRYQPLSTKEDKEHVSIESEDIDRSFFYNKKRRQADFELLEQEMLAREEKYNNGKCSSKNTITALRKAAQMITCSIPPTSAVDKDAMEPLLLSASVSQAPTEVENTSNSSNNSIDRCHCIEEIHKSHVNTEAVANTSKLSKPVQSRSNSNDTDHVFHASTKDSFLTELNNPALSSKLASKSIWNSQHAMALSHMSRPDSRQAYVVPNSVAQGPTKDATLHITSSVDLGAGLYNLSFASLRPMTRSQIGTNVPAYSHNTRQVSRFEVVHTIHKPSYTNRLVNLGPDQGPNDTSLVQRSPIPVTILDFFGS